MHREETPALYQKIARRHLPIGWTMREERLQNERGICIYDKKLLIVWPLLTRGDLFVALHECAHARLHKTTGMAAHVEEYEAEQFAMALMRLEGIPVPRRELYLARENVRGRIAEDEKKGWAIDPTIRKWASRR